MNLQTLGNTSNEFDDVAAHISARMKVLGPADDAVSYFKAESYKNVASDLGLVKNDLSKGLATISSALGGIDAGIELLNQMKALANNALGSASATERASLATQFDAKVAELTKLVADATFDGTNLIKGTPDSLTVRLNETGTNTYTVTGVDLSSAGLTTPLAASANAWVGNVDITASLTEIDAALSQYRTSAASLGDASSFMQTRLDFTENKINLHEAGASRLINMSQAEYTQALAEQNSAAASIQSGAGVLSKIKGNDDLIMALLGR